jgi:hypothetical protein
MAFYAFFISAELPNTCLNPHYFCNRNILAKFIEAALIFRRDILSVIIIQIRKGRPQNMRCDLIRYCCLFDVHFGLPLLKNLTMPAERGYIHRSPDAVPGISVKSEYPRNLAKILSLDTIDN